jgi:hypothetical protein
MKKSLCVSIFALLILVPGVALAGWSVYFPGDDGVGNNGIHYNYDMIKSYIVTPGETFAAAGITGQKSGWTVQNIGLTQVNMSGPAESGYFGWTYNFAGAAAPALLTIDYYVFANNVNTGAFEIYIRNGNWSYPDYKVIPTVPIPPAVWLLGSGLLGLVAIRRRMQK